MQAAERDREFVADLAAEVEFLGEAHARQRCLKCNSLNGIEKIGFVLPNRQMPNGQMSLSDPRIGEGRVVYHRGPAFARRALRWTEEVDVTQLKRTA